MRHHACSVQFICVILYDIEGVWFWYLVYVTLMQVSKHLIIYFHTNDIYENRCGEATSEDSRK